jgi:hypothetical protein
MAARRISLASPAEIALPGSSLTSSKPIAFKRQAWAELAGR